MNERSSVLRWVLAAGLLALAAAASAGQSPQDRAYARARAGDPSALRALRSDAEAGIPAAELMLGNLFYAGEGLAQDYAAALAWYAKAAAAGLSEAQFNMGQIYRKGQGVAADPEAAAAWYRKAATLGNADAMYNLGGMYLQGFGVPRDPAEAGRLFRNAAARGHARAWRFVDRERAERDSRRGV